MLLGHVTTPADLLGPQAWFERYPGVGGDGSAVRWWLLLIRGVGYPGVAASGGSPRGNVLQFLCGRA